MTTSPPIYLELESEHVRDDGHPPADSRAQLAGKGAPNPVNYPRSRQPSRGAPTEVRAPQPFFRHYANVDVAYVELVCEERRNVERLRAHTRRITLGVTDPINDST